MDTRVTTRTRLSVLPIFIALMLNLVIGPLAPSLPPIAGDSSVLAAATVDPEDGIEGCMGVRTTPGSDNTTKQLIGGSLEPGGTAIFQFTFPATAGGNPGQEEWKLTDCVFLNGEPFQKYTVTALENDTSPVVIDFTLTIPTDAPLGGEYCNYAKTTEAPSDPQASNRKAGPACFTIGGALRVLKVDQNQQPLAGATFTVACDWPDVSAGTFLPDTILSVPTNGSINGGASTETIDSTDDGSFTRTVITGDQGAISVNGPDGTVCTFTETAAPAGFLPPAAPGNTVTLTINVEERVATHTFTNTRAMPDVVVTKSASQSSVLAPYTGLVYTLTASNTGTAAATGVIIADNLDDDLVVTSAVWDNDPGTAGATGTCTVDASTNAISCAVGTLAASDGDTTGAEPDVATATITVNVPVAACPSISNTAAVSATNEETAQQGNNTSNTVDVTVNCPDASVLKTATDPTIIGGETAAFSIVVSGGTLGTNSAVTLTDVLPAGFTWTVGGADIGNCWVGANSSDPLAAGETVVGGSTLNCDFGALAANATRTITLSATTTLAACEATISNTATISVAGDTSTANNSSTATIDVQCPDASVVKSAVDASINAGESAAFSVVVTAGGSGDSENVVLTDVNPAGSGRTWAVSGTDSGACNDLSVAPGETLTCDFGDIPNGETRTITITTTSSTADCADAIENTASIVADDDVDPSNNEDSASITVACPDLTLDKSASTLTVLAPDSVEYSIFVTNDGEGTAANAVVSDNLDDDLTIVGTVEYDLGDDGSADGTCSVSAGNVISCDLGDLAAGATASITFTVTVPTAACADDLTNTASVAATNEPGNLLENNSDTVEIEVDCPDVSVQKTASDPVISSTESASFSITADAGALGTTSDVTLSDSVPAGFTWTVGGADIGNCWIGADDSNPLSAGDTVAGGSTLNCNFGPLDANETRTITLTAETSATDCDLTISNTATVAADGDTNTTNNSSTATVDVECPDLVIEKRADDAVVSAGDPIGFWIDVANLGPGSAFDASLTDLLPDGTGVDWAIDELWVDGAEIEDPSEYCSISGTPPSETLNCDFGTMDAEASASVHVTSATTEDSCATYENTATIGAGNHADVQSLEAAVTVECPGLNILKSAEADPIDAGEAASFEIVVWNTGPGAAFDVTLEDELPEGLTWSEDSDDCSIAGGILTCDFGDLGVTTLENSPARVTVTADTERADCGLLENTAFADASNDDEVDSTDTITVKCPTVSIVKTNNQTASVLPGTAVTFTLAVTVSDGPADDVVVVDTLPVGYDTPTAISGGGTYAPATRTITWNLGDGLANGTYQLTYQAAVSAGTAQGASLVNVAVVTSSNSQCPSTTSLAPECDDDSTVTVRVLTLVIDKVASTETITISGPNTALVATPSVVTWTLSYTLTNGPVTGAVITDQVPVGFTFLDAANGGTFANGTVTWNLGTLSASGSVTFRTTVNPTTISRTGPTVNTAVIDSNETAPDNGQDSVRVEVEPPPLAGNPTPRPSMPNTAIGFGVNGEPVTIPVELLVAFFVGSLGALALANVKARSRRS